MKAFLSAKRKSGDDAAFLGGKEAVVLALQKGQLITNNGFPNDLR